jgi:outer membrane protein assembly factor BamD (BamD/ComL family)
MNTKKVVAICVCTVLLASIAGCGKKASEHKNYFKRDEFKQSSSFRLPQHMTYAELKHEKERLVKAGQEYIAINFLAHMIKKCADPDMLEQLRLEFADMLYKLERFGEAATEYQVYAQLYPGSAHAAYADFQAINAVNNDVLAADLDQDHTQDVIDLAKKFAQKAERRADYAKYLFRVEALAQRCCRRLYDGEVLHFYFNLNHSQFKAAQARLDWIKSRYASCAQTPEILELEYRLALAQGKQEHAEKKAAEIAKKFPNYKIERYKERNYAAYF